MTKATWTPWHEVARLRDDLRSGDLSLSLFAADLYEVAMQRGARPVYESPAEFFTLTYPTHNLRELAKDVVERLEGRTDKAVRQLELTYGGGKTHALITLFHLARQVSPLPDLPAAREFIEHIGAKPSPATVAVLPFDKLDVEKGMEVRGPNGETRWLVQPWSVLAFQIAGNEGLQILHAAGKDEERSSAPAENLLRDILAIPGREQKGTLVLIDEVLMFAREKIGLNPDWRGTLLNFFQYLSQAATKVDRCAVVASLLATDPRKSDALGKELTHDLYAIFRREREQAVEPVVKEDVAEVLRRRFFTPESISSSEEFKAHVVAGLKGIYSLDDMSRKAGVAVEERFLRSYPFHPDLTEVLYSKWTQLESFQRTRGVLRTFALALREAEQWDRSPFIGPAVFLSSHGSDDLSPAAREMTTVSASEEYEGKRQEWAAILRGELEKARSIQDDYPGLMHREIEQAVFATFLHSQPIWDRHKATTRDLMLLLGSTRPDQIELAEGLRKWADLSWFLDEASINTASKDNNGRLGLPTEWRLGTRPNLKQMHHEATNGLDASWIRTKMQASISTTKSLTAGVSGSGARCHSLPEGPRDVEDNGEMHFVILGPDAVSDSGKPSREAQRYIKETTGPDRPRVYQNAIVVATPSRDGLAALEASVQEYLGWENVQTSLAEQELDPIREQMLAGYLREARDKIPSAVRTAYCIVVTLNEAGDIQAFRMTAGDHGPLFTAIKSDQRARIQEGAVSAEALLPGGPYDLWRQGETSRRFQDLAGAFAQFPHLPKMLSKRAVRDTVVQGCVEGLLVLSLSRPDGSRRTWWRTAPDDIAIKDPALEVVLPDHAELDDIEPSILSHGRLPGLWDQEEITVSGLEEYFSGSHVAMIQKDGYEEPLAVPKAESKVIKEAVASAVSSGNLWLLSSPASLWKEEVPAGVISGSTRLRKPLEPIPTTRLLPENLPDAWDENKTTGLALVTSLSSDEGLTLPWMVVREAIDGALRSRFVIRTKESGPWPCDLPQAQQLILRLPSPYDVKPPKPGVEEPQEGTRIAIAELQTHELQDLADRIGDITQIVAGEEFRLEVKIEIGGAQPPAREVEEKINEILEEIKNDFRLG
jgi:hypothetical protein